MKDMGKMLKQAQELQAKLQGMQEELQHKTVEALGRTLQIVD